MGIQKPPFKKTALATYGLLAGMRECAATGFKVRARNGCEALVRVHGIVAVGGCRGLNRARTECRALTLEPVALVPKPGAIGKHGQRFWRRNGEEIFAGVSAEEGGMWES